MSSNIPVTVQISRATGRRRTSPAIPSTATLAALQPKYVLGGSLDRIYAVDVPNSLVRLTGPSRQMRPSVLYTDPKTSKMWIRADATPEMQRIGCDACSLYHTKKNTYCHANTPESLKYMPRNHAFLTDGTYAGKFMCSDVARNPGGKRAIVRFSLV